MNGNRTPATLAVSLASLLLAGTAQAGDPAAGKAKSATCVACHGEKGISAQPIYPNLAGQKEQYLVLAMEAYKSGARSNPIMKPMAAMLSSEDIKNLAAYYASLGGN